MNERIRKLNKVSSDNRYRQQAHEQRQSDGMPKTLVRMTEEEKKAHVKHLGKEMREYSPFVIGLALIVGEKVGKGKL